MAHLVVQVGNTPFYAALLDASGKLLPAKYLATPEGGQRQRLRLGAKWMMPGSAIQISLSGNLWLGASVVEVGEFTRSLGIVVERPRSKPAIAIRLRLPPTLLARWS